MEGLSGESTVEQCAQFPPLNGKDTVNGISHQVAEQGTQAPLFYGIGPQHHLNDMMTVAFLPSFEVARDPADARCKAQCTYRLGR